MNIEGIALGTREATIAAFAIKVGDTEYAAQGTSKRDPHDSDDPEIAELLAVGRALESLSGKLLKRANGLVKHNDDVRKYREIQKARKATVKKPYRASKAKKATGNKTLAKAGAKR